MDHAPQISHSLTLPARDAARPDRAAIVPLFADRPKHPTPTVPFALRLLYTFPGAAAGKVIEMIYRREGGPMSEVVDEEVNVLFIEDDPAVAEMYKLKLELDGYRVTVAKSGEEGLDQAKKLIPDIVFLDIRLPKMDGFAVLENLRQDAVTKNIPVIILSNYGEKELVDRGLKLGALDYLIKSETTPASLSRGVQDWVKD
jgi:CheY-like chemotaxis protein